MTGTDLIAYLLARIDEEEQEADVEAFRLDEGPEWWMPEWMTRERMYVEFAVKREILAWIGDHEFDRNGSSWGILCALAKPYASRPDFDPNWGNA